jgi:hypothetical protein
VAARRRPRTSSRRPTRQPHYARSRQRGVRRRKKRAHDERAAVAFLAVYGDRGPAGSTSRERSLAQTGPPRSAQPCSPHDGVGQDAGAVGVLGSVLLVPAIWMGRNVVNQQVDTVATNVAAPLLQANETVARLVGFQARGAGRLVLTGGPGAPKRFDARAQEQDPRLRTRMHQSDCGPGGLSRRARPQRRVERTRLSRRRGLSLHPNLNPSLPLGRVSCRFRRAAPMCCIGVTPFP